MRRAKRTKRPATERQQTAEETADRKARLEYLRSIQPPKKRQPLWARILSIFVVLALLGAVGVAIRWKFFGDGRTERIAMREELADEQDRERQRIANLAGKTAHHNSSKLGLELDYPATWKAVEGGDGRLTVTSPPAKLQGEHSEQITGQTVFEISPEGQGLNGFDAGNAVAVRDSEQLRYTKPGPSQREASQLTFAQFFNTNTRGALNAMYLTGDLFYQKGQVIPRADMVHFSPLISVSFIKCADKLCKQGAPTSIRAAMWDDTSFAKPIKGIISSLRFK